jgi:hypothetical protein
MTVVLTEADLRFTFAGHDTTSARKLDVQGQTLPRGMCLVDFAVTEDTLVLLVEVKDPSCAGATAQEQQRFVRSLAKDNLVNEELVPKMRDSYCFLHLMAQDVQPCLAVVLLGLDACAHDPALLLPFKERLLSRLRKETNVAWERQYVSDCVVLTTSNWDEVFPDYPIERIAPPSP